MAFRRLSPALTLSTLVILAPVLRGQAPPVAPNPQAPTLNVPVPLGIQRGVPLELTLTGTNLAEPTGLWTSFPAKVTIPTDKNNGKDNANLRVNLEVPKDAPLGFHTIRLATTRGLSNLRTFCIDDLPQIMEVDTNRAQATAQALPIPCVVVGRTDAEVSDYYKITVQAGQRVSFEVLGRRLGSGLDPQLSLIDPRSRHELAYSNDAPGLQTDPRLTYVFKDAGDYLIEVRDTKWAGGGDFHYRLRIGDFPCATTPLPMAGKRGTKQLVRFAGPQVDGVSPVEVPVPTDPLVQAVWVTPRGANGLPGWPVALGVSDLDEVLEPEAAGAPPLRVPAPGAVTGRFLQKGEVDHYLFAAKKGQRFIIQVHTHEFYSPTEVYLVLKNAAGATIAATNPAMEPRLDFSAPADGDYALDIENLIYAGGPEETYRITLIPYEPGFDITLGIDRYDIPAGSVAVMPIQAAVFRDYNGPVEVSVIGHAGLAGQVVLHPAPPVPNQPAGLLFISAKPDLPPGPYEIAIQAKAVINGKPVITYASAREIVKQNLAGLPYPPPGLGTKVGVAIIEKAPFALVVKFDQPEGLRGVPLGVTLTATRAAGFAEEIAITPVGLPPNVAPALKNIAKGQNEVKVQLTAAVAVPVGQHFLGFTGRTKFQNKDYAVTTAPVNLALVLPFELKIEPAPIKIVQGAKVKFKVTAVRKGGYQGPIALQAQNLPANVTVPVAMIAMGQNVVEIEATAAANAAPGDKPDFHVVGTAPPAGNQQNVSPNVVLSVVKK
jgi:hypothetical protein